MRVGAGCTLSHRNIATSQQADAEADVEHLPSRLLSRLLLATFELFVTSLPVSVVVIVERRSRVCLKRVSICFCWQVSPPHALSRIHSVQFKSPAMEEACLTALPLPRFAATALGGGSLGAQLSTLRSGDHPFDLCVTETTLVANEVALQMPYVNLVMQTFCNLTDLQRAFHRRIDKEWRLDV